MGEGRLGLLDFGLVGFLRSDDLNEGARLFLHVMHADIGGIKRSLRRLGVEWNPSVDEMVSQAIEEAFSRYFGRSLSTIDVSALLRQVFDMVYTLRLQLPARFLLLDKALLTMEGLVSQLYPDLDVFRLAGKYTDEVKKQQLDPRQWSERVRREVARYADMLRDYPVQLHDLLEEMRAGELEVKFRHVGLEDVMHRLDIIANRVVVALVSIALGVTGAFIAVNIEGGPQIAGLSVWGIPGFVMSVFFGIWLVWAIIRSGRL
jgi:ubiquinone biosynthesis protein